MDATAGTRTRGSDVVQGAVWFALLTPLVAWALWVLAGVAAGYDDELISHMSDWGARLRSLYIAGAAVTIPAGAIAGARRHIPSTTRALLPSVLVVTAGGALLGAVFHGAVAGVLGALAGGIAAAVTGALFVRAMNRQTGSHLLRALRSALISARYALIGIVVFGVLGPLLGMQATALLSWLIDHVDGSVATRNRSLVIDPLLLAIVYVVGIVPAMVTGLAAGAQRHRTHGRELALIAMGIGAGSSAIMGAFYSALAGVFLAGVGAIAALTTTPIFLLCTRANAPATASPTDARQAAWAGALVYGVLGPTVAFALMAIPAALSLVMNGSSALPVELGPSAPSVWGITYLAGLLPGAITGAIAGVLRPRVHRTQLLGWVVLAGACTAFGIGALATTFEATLAFAALGAASAALVTLWFLRSPRTGASAATGHPSSRDADATGAAA